ncbi:MAG: hypothetical protein SX243_04980 [Acidobacteriota bacterium]|nr:hypothetical protein [Acidobacteriota bacterium]
MRKLNIALAVFALLSALIPAAIADAGEIEKTFPFELDRWYDLEVEDGPVTLHRIRVKHDDRKIRKSNIFRGGDTPYADTVVIELDYTNESDNDWEAKVLVHWRDSKKRPIDGYDDEEGLSEDERHETATMTIATLKYGLEVARDLYVNIEFYRD